MASKPTFGFALAYVKDIEAAKQFYGDVLGMEVARAAPVFVQFKDHFAIPHRLAGLQHLVHRGFAGRQGLSGQAINAIGAAKFAVDLGYVRFIAP